MPSLRLTICQREFHVACADDDSERMQDAAREVEARRDELREKTKTADGERLALMTALQIAFESAQPAQPIQSNQNINGDVAIPQESESTKTESTKSTLEISAKVHELCEKMHKRMDNTLVRTESSLHKRALNDVNQ